MASIIAASASPQATLVVSAFTTSWPNANLRIRHATFSRGLSPGCPALCDPAQAAASPAWELASYQRRNSFRALPWAILRRSGSLMGAWSNQLAASVISSYG